MRSNFSLTRDIMLLMRKSIYTNTQIQRRLLQSKEILMNERKRRLTRSTAVSFQQIKSTSMGKVQRNAVRASKILELEFPFYCTLPHSL